MLGRARLVIGRSQTADTPARGRWQFPLRFAQRLRAPPRSALGPARRLRRARRRRRGDMLDLVRRTPEWGRQRRRFPRKSTSSTSTTHGQRAGARCASCSEDFTCFASANGGECGAVFVRVRARKDGLGVLDIDDLLLHLARALARGRRGGAEKASAGEHLLVDEYQDVTGSRSTSCAPARGSVPTSPWSATTACEFTDSARLPRHILYFPAASGTEIVTLERNYRAHKRLRDRRKPRSPEQATRAYSTKARAPLSATGGRAPELSRAPRRGRRPEQGGPRGACSTRASAVGAAPRPGVLRSDSHDRTCSSL